MTMPSPVGSSTPEDGALATALVPNDANGRDRDVALVCEAASGRNPPVNAQIGERDAVNIWKAGRSRGHSKW